MSELENVVSSRTMPSSKLRRVFFLLYPKQAIGNKYLYVPT